MAFTPWSGVNINAGQATKEEIFQLIKSNQESFNTDIEALKSTATFNVFNVKYVGNVNQYTQTELDNLTPTFKAPVNGALANAGTTVGFTVTLLEASTSGTLQVNLQKSTDNGINWSPLLNNPVEVTTSTVGSVSGTVDWLDLPSQSFNQGDLLRIKIDGLQVNQGAFHISIYAEVA